MHSGPKRFIGFRWANEHDITIYRTPKSPTQNESTTASPSSWASGGSSMDAGEDEISKVKVDVTLPVRIFTNVDSRTRRMQAEGRFIYRKMHAAITKIRNSTTTTMDDGSSNIGAIRSALLEASKKYRAAMERCATGLENDFENDDPSAGSDYLEQLKVALSVWGLAEIFLIGQASIIDAPLLRWLVDTYPIDDEDHADLQCLNTYLRGEYHVDQDIPATENRIREVWANGRHWRCVCLLAMRGDPGAPVLLRGLVNQAQQLVPRDASTVAQFGDALVRSGGALCQLLGEPDGATPAGELGAGAVPTFDEERKGGGGAMGVGEFALEWRQWRSRVTAVAQQLQEARARLPGVEVLGDEYGQVLDGLTRVCAVLLGREGAMEALDPVVQWHELMGGKVRFQEGWQLRKRFDCWKVARHCIDTCQGGETNDYEQCFLKIMEFDVTAAVETLFRLECFPQPLDDEEADDDDSAAGGGTTGTIGGSAGGSGRPPAPPVSGCPSPFATAHLLDLLRFGGQFNGLNADAHGCELWELLLIEHAAAVAGAGAGAGSQSSSSSGGGGVVTAASLAAAAGYLGSGGCGPRGADMFLALAARAALGSDAEARMVIDKVEHFKHADAQTNAGAGAGVGAAAGAAIADAAWRGRCEGVIVGVCRQRARAWMRQPQSGAAGAGAGAVGGGGEEEKDGGDGMEGVTGASAGSDGSSSAAIHPMALHWLRAAARHQRGGDGGTASAGSAAAQLEEAAAAFARQALGPVAALLAHHPAVQRLGGGGGGPEGESDGDARAAEVSTALVAAGKRLAAGVEALVGGDALVALRAEQQLHQSRLGGGSEGGGVAVGAAPVGASDEPACVVVLWRLQQLVSVMADLAAVQTKLFAVIGDAGAGGGVGVGAGATPAGADLTTRVRGILGVGASSAPAPAASPAAASVPALLEMQGHLVRLCSMGAAHLAGAEAALPTAAAAALARSRTAPDLRTGNGGALALGERLLAEPDALGMRGVLAPPVLALAREQRGRADHLQAEAQVALQAGGGSGGSGGSGGGDDDGVHVQLPCAEVLALLRVAEDGTGRGGDAGALGADADAEEEVQALRLDMAQQMAGIIMCGGGVTN